MLGPQAPFGRSWVNISHRRSKFGLPIVTINNFNDLELAVRRLASRILWLWALIHNCSILIKQHGNKGKNLLRVAQSELGGDRIAHTHCEQVKAQKAEEEDLNWISAPGLLLPWWRGGEQAGKNRRNKKKKDQEEETVMQSRKSLILQHLFFLRHSDTQECTQNAHKHTQ